MSLTLTKSQQILKLNSKILFLTCLISIALRNKDLVSKKFKVIGTTLRMMILQCVNNILLILYNICRRNQKQYPKTSRMTGFNNQNLSSI